MNIKEKLGTLYAIMHCADRPCSNCVAIGTCGSEKNKDALFASLIDDIDNIIKERDEAIAKLKEASDEN